MFIYYLFISPFIAILFILINYLFSINNNYLEKLSPFECGFTSYHQSRSSFNVSFILIAILFLPFDLEISSLLPYVISAYNLNIYGHVVIFLFLFILIIVFVFELNLNALKLINYYKSHNNDLFISLYK